MIDLNSLNPQQREAVTTIQGPVMILAGAGTGKTRVITYRVANLIENGVTPWKILAVTFTNKAAREMQERVAALVPKDLCKDTDGKVQRPTICTFHSLCVRILRRYIDRLGYKNNFVIYDESDQLGAVRKIMSHIHVDGEKLEPKAVHALMSKYKNNGNDAFLNQPESLIVFAQHVQRLYESALKAANAVDFDDIILLVLKLFNEHPDTLEACRRQYQYIMVDEYQDTNSSQFQLVNLLAGEHRNLCVVGDDDQSIYGWRGAQISNLLDLEKFYPEVKIVKLEQNYRSTNIILKAANKVIQKNVRRREKNLWSTQETGELIKLATYDNAEDEAQGVVDQIEMDRVNGVPWQKQAILFRTNQQSRPIEMALRKKQIRYNLVGGQSFFDRSEIRDFLAYVKTLINPNDDINLLRIANTPPRGLSDVTMERLLGISQEHHKSVFGVMEDVKLIEHFLSRIQLSINNFHELITSTRNMLMAKEVGFPLNDWLDEFLDDQGLYAYIRRVEKTAEAGDMKISNIRQMLKDLEPHTKKHSPMEALQEFLEEITLDNELSEEGEQKENAVTLITMHSCKGLEYPYVHIVGLEEGILPHSRSKMEGTLDEERRLFYVAITRAKEVLYLSHCTGRRQYGQLMPCHPSQFLMEMPEELMERSDVIMRTVPTQEAAQNIFADIFSQIG